MLLDIISQNPYQTPSNYEKLSGNLQGSISRRINKQHRLIYKLREYEKNYCYIQYVNSLRIIIYFEKKLYFLFLFQDHGVFPNPNNPLLFCSVDASNNAELADEFLSRLKRLSVFAPVLKIFPNKSK